VSEPDLGADSGEPAHASMSEGQRVAESRADDLRVRPMTSGDLPDVLRIERVSFPTPWSERTFRNLMRRANARLWVAESHGGELLGYAVVWFAGPEAELGDIAVRPAARRAGVGRALVGIVLEDAKSHGIQLVFLEVRETNSAARRLYEEAGFQTVGCRPGYYAQPVEDALVMSIDTTRHPR
jgi:ribosomal-protein-alanine N-acetyltransferase